MFHYYTLNRLINPITGETIIPAGEHVHVTGNPSNGMLPITYYGKFGNHPIKAFAPVEQILCFDAPLKVNV